MRIGLLPLDERPVNTQYPAQIAAIGGAELLLPPPEALCQRRTPADHAALAAWMQRSAPDLDALIVSVELLGYGGLIAARTTAEPAAAVLTRLEALRGLRRAYPALTIYGFNVVTRVSNADDAVEEPEYWADDGTRLYALSQALHRQQRGAADAAEIAALAAQIPAEHRADFLRRRLRNHTVNLAALGLLADGTLDLLVLSADDTNSDGLPAWERGWLAQWGTLLETNNPQMTQMTQIGPPAADQRLLMYPGADEVGSVLVARLLNARAGAAPTVYAAYAPPEGAAVRAAYEDGPVSATVARQVAAVGGRLVENPDAADLWLAVNAPHHHGAEWDAARADADRLSRRPALMRTVAELVRRQRAGQAVAVADLAYPNGADPVLLDLLIARADLPALAAYGGWNTAGNTIGTTLAQASAARLAQTPAQRLAHERLLVHRFVEDWGYQHLIRAETRETLRLTSGSQEPTAAGAAAVAEIIALRLDEQLQQLPGFAGRYTVPAGGVTLPWGRTFEIGLTVRGPLERG